MLVDEIYCGEDSIVCYWLKVLWNMDGWWLDVVYMLGEVGGVCYNLQYVVGIIWVVKEVQFEVYIVGEYFGDVWQWLQVDVEDVVMNYCGFIFLLWGFFVNIDIVYELQYIDVWICIMWMDNYCVGLLYQ